MLKPSEYLKSKGWKPTNPNCPPRDSAWVDPATKVITPFIEAVLIQGKRDDQSKEDE